MNLHTTREERKAHIDGCIERAGGHTNPIYHLAQDCESLQDALDDAQAQIEKLSLHAAAFPDRPDWIGEHLQAWIQNKDAKAAQSKKIAHEALDKLADSQTCVRLLQDRLDLAERTLTGSGWAAVVGCDGPALKPPLGNKPEFLRIEELQAEVERLKDQVHTAQEYHHKSCRERDADVDRAEQAVDESNAYRLEHNNMAKERDAAIARAKNLAGLLRESNRCLKEAKHKWAPTTTNSDADVAIARNDAALAEQTNTQGKQS